MKIMVFGDTASGKSTFADLLGKKLDVPVIHLDRLHGENWSHIGAYIHEAAATSDWIIDGNAFQKDPDFRINRADIIVVFTAPRLVTFWRYLSRFMRQRWLSEKRIGGNNIRLDLRYYFEYIFLGFPGRKETAVQKAIAVGKMPLVVKNYAQANQLLNRWE